MGVLLSDRKASIRTRGAVILNGPSIGNEAPLVLILAPSCMFAPSPNTFHVLTTFKYAAVYALEISGSRCS